MSKLEQSEGIATRRVQHPGRNFRRNVAASGLLQECGRRRLVEAARPELGNPGSKEWRLLALTNRNEDRNRVREQPASSESDGLRRSTIEPLGVVHGDQGGRLLRVSGN